MDKHKIVAIVGPTATGKSTLAIHLAKKFNGEVISADSRQLYTGLDLGTGKVTTKEMMGVPHYLLDISNPKKVVTVSDYAALASKALKKIAINKSLPIICGGSGFYIETFLSGTIYPEVAPNKKLRTKFEKLSVSELMKKLTTLDPKRAETIDKYNKVRIIRALEIINTLGHVPTIKTTSQFDVLFIGLNTHERLLRRQIQERLISRIQRGMIKEASTLHKKGLSYKRMQDLGLEYKYLAAYLQKKISKKEMTDQLETAIWQYSRKQMTWFRKNPAIVWLDPKNKTTIKKAEVLVKTFIQKEEK
jgi:tRNA dimethylallyltransferase